MRAGRVSFTLAGVITIAVLVYAGDALHMKCSSQECRYEAQVTFGGGMAFEQLTGYCRTCKKFVYLQWTREGSPVVDAKSEKVPHPKSLGEVVDVRTGGVLNIYACPHCKGPFAEIKSKEDLKHCPACSKPGFGIDDTKPAIAVD
jgi:hypothetical protein